MQKIIERLKSEHEQIHAHLTIESALYLIQASIYNSRRDIYNRIKNDVDNNKPGENIYLEKLYPALVEKLAPYTYGDEKQIIPLYDIYHTFYSIFQTQLEASSVKASYARIVQNEIGKIEKINIDSVSWLKKICEDQNKFVNEYHNFSIAYHEICASVKTLIQLFNPGALAFIPTVFFPCDGILPFPTYESVFNSPFLSTKTTFEEAFAVAKYNQKIIQPILTRIQMSVKNDLGTFQEEMNQKLKTREFHVDNGKKIMDNINKFNEEKKYFDEFIQETGEFDHFWSNDPDDGLHFSTYEKFIAFQTYLKHLDEQYNNAKTLEAHQTIDRNDITRTRNKLLDIFIEKVANHFEEELNNPECILKQYI